MLNLVLGMRKVDFDWQDEKITIEMRALKTSEVLLLVPLMEKANTNPTQEDVFKLQSIAKEIYKEAVGSIEGITIDGKSITGNDLCEEAALAELNTLVITKLIEISGPTKVEEKNSEGLSASAQ